MHPLLDKFGVTRLIKAFFYSVDGLKVAWKEEQAFRLEIYACIIMAPIALILDVSLIEKALLLGSLLLVLAIELVNTAVEATVNLITQERNPFAKKAKDAASAAVLMALGIAGLIWLAILL